MRPPAELLRESASSSLPLLERIGDAASAQPHFHEPGWRTFLESQPVTLEDLIVDHVLHLRRHLAQIVPLPG